MMANRRLWLLVAALALFGRIYQRGVLWPEETLPLAAAQHLLAGKVLYSDVWFDKPPLLAWFYASILKLAGPGGYALRLAGAAFVVAVSLAGFALSRRLWDERAAGFTAVLLAFFLTFYHHAATVALAADLLLVLPHLAAFWLLASGWTFAAGLVIGLAFHLHAKAIFVLAAAAGWLLLDRSPRGLAALAAGFATAAAAGLAVLAATGGWEGYVEQVWRWGSAYARAPFTDHPWPLGLERTANYLGFHAALLLGAGLFFWRPPEGLDRRRHIALWLVVSAVAVVLGGRFFPRYYFQVLPALAMAAGAGWSSLLRGGAGVPLQRAGIVVLAVALAVPAIRFGRMNLRLALRRSWDWTDVAIDRDSRLAAARLRQMTEPGDRIFVWGFRPEIYYYAGRLAASRFLESQPLTGVLADRHLQRSEPFRPEWAAAHRQELAGTLLHDPPAMIVDGLARYNPVLAMEQYEELGPPLQQYSLVSETAGSRLYLLRNRQGREIPAPGP
jgi:4-amino-4-deoxy-L-arabinose transferase-like glycosyltransferase